MPTFYVALKPTGNTLTRIVDVMGQLGNPCPDPHITLRAPDNLTSDLTWLASLKELAATAEPFAVAFAETRTFGDRVLYLSVDSIGVIELHERILKVLGPDRGFAGASSPAKPYVAHLTLLVAPRHQALPAYEDVTSRLGDLEPFEATELTVLSREDSSTRYRTCKRVPLDVPRGG
jgi:2'-5' RNA ligase